MATSGRELAEQVRALDELTRKDGRIPVEQVEETLVWAVSNPFGSWEGSRAASMAAQLLSYIEKCRFGDGLERPSDTPDAIAQPDAYWPYDVRPARHGLEDFRDLDQAQVSTEGERDEWRRRLEPPPWKPEPVESAE